MCFCLVVFCLFFKNPLLSARRMRCLKRKNEKKKNKKKKKMDQFLPYKKGNLGPVFNSTAYIYVAYIYIYIPISLYIYIWLKPRCQSIYLSIYLSIYRSVPITSSDGPLLGFKKSRSRGKEKQNKDKGKSQGTTREFWENVWSNNFFPQSRGGRPVGKFWPDHKATTATFFCPFFSF